MSLYKVDKSSKGLIPIANYSIAEGLYEKEIEELLAENLDDTLGTPLFHIARQAHLPGGGIPDILALDASGRVVVIEVKRDVDRKALSQALEYAGWARATHLEELSTLYEHGIEQFWDDWQEFTQTAQPVPVLGHPQLVLAAEDFHTRTEAAISFLRDSGLPLTLLKVTMYRDVEGNKFIDVDLEGSLASRPSMVSAPISSASTIRKVRRRFTTSIADLINVGMLKAGEVLTWNRPQSGQTFHITVEPDGRLRLPNDSLVSSLSAAADTSVGHGSYPGWECWRRQDGTLLYALRDTFEAQQNNSSEETPD